MSAWVCGECTAAYSVGAPRCPQCGAQDPRVADEAEVTRRVRCLGQDCDAYGVVRVVPVRLVAPGVVERPPLHCTGCDRFMETVGDEESGDEMPKISVHEGPTNAADPGDEPHEGGEESSPTPEAPGTSSPTSFKKAVTSPETSTSEAPSRARTTGSRSGKGRTGSSSARGTDGAPTAPTSDPSSTES